jgi:hypothetical protein
MKSVLRWCVILSVATTLAAQTDTAPKPKKKARPATITAADVQALKDAIAAQQAALAQQQQEIQQLSDQLKQNQQNAQQAQAAATDAASKANAAQSQATEDQQTVVALKSDVTDLKTNVTNTAMTIQETQKDINASMKDPMSIHYKGISFTVGGFVAAEFVRRSRALAADLPTPFNSLTMPGASQSQLSEFFGSGRQSRPTLFIEGRTGHVDFSAYLSGDFLSAADTSTATQTNSYSLRLRQAWGQAKFDNGWSILGGQMWSLVTEGKASIAPSDDLGRVNDARPSTIDPGYNVGFSFARQYALRVTKAFGSKFAVAAAVENAQGTLTTHNNADNFLLGSAGASNSYNDAITGCTTNNYTPTNATSPTYYVTCTPAGTYTFNPSPDVIAKVAFDPGFGHYEIFGLYDRFRDRVFPCADFILGTTGPCPNDPALTGPNGSGAYNVSRNGGGFGANARWNFDNKHVVFGLHFFGGRGVGRYGAAQLSDLTIKADGAPALLKNGQGLATLEWHGKKLDLYAYTGAEFDGRSTDYDPVLKKYVGYGSELFKNSGCYTEIAPSIGVTAGFNPGSLANCTADARAVIEGTAGFWYRFYQGPKGSFRFGTQYSYVTKQTWSGESSLGAGSPGVSPEGLDGMVFTSFRYYLP